MGWKDKLRKGKDTTKRKWRWVKGKLRRNKSESEPEYEAIFSPLLTKEDSKFLEETIEEQDEDIKITKEIKAKRIERGERLELVDEDEIEVALGESITEGEERAEVKTENIVLLLRSNSYSNKEQVRETLTDLFSKRKPDNVKFLLIKEKGVINDWLEEHGFYYEIHKKRKGEERIDRNIRIVRECKALVAFIKRKSKGDDKWSFVKLMLKMEKSLYLVYDEGGNIYDKKRRRIRTPYAQD